MYEITATSEFIDLLRELPIGYAHILTHSFISIKKVKDVCKTDNTFMDDLLEQIMYQEVE